MVCPFEWAAFLLQVCFVCFLDLSPNETSGNYYTRDCFLCLIIDFMCVGKYLKSKFYFFKCKLCPLLTFNFSIDDLLRFVLILLRMRMCEFLAGKKHSNALIIGQHLCLFFYCLQRILACACAIKSKQTATSHLYNHLPSRSVKSELNQILSAPF